jgi:hypothetical protein
VIWRWQGRPLLANAICPRCKVTRLDRTAARLVKRIPIVEQTPLVDTGRRS